MYTALFCVNTMHAFATAVPLRIRRPTARCARRPRSKIHAAYVDLEAVKRAVRLSDVLRDLETDSKMRPRGEGEWMACCPFHEDSSPSMSVSDKRGLFFCFACGATGDVIEFERRSRGLKSIPDALVSLAGRYSSVRQLVAGAPRTLEYSTPVPVQPAIRKLVNWGAIVNERRSVNSVLQNAVPLFVNTLSSKSGAVYRSYLEGRGVSERTMRAFQIGAAGPPKAWSYAHDALIEAGHTTQELINAGIAAKSKTGKVFDAFRGRLVFPICDKDGAALAIAGRLLVDSERAPKYVNSKETTVFKKKSVLFGAHLARDALLAIVPVPQERSPFDMSEEEDEDADLDDDEIYEEMREKEDAEAKVVRRHLNGGAPIVEQFLGAPITVASLVVVEGYMDVIALFEHSDGRFPVVATMGTAVSAEQVQAAYNLLPDPLECSVIFNFDNDEAGVRAAERLCDVVLSEVPDAFRAAIAFAPKSVKDVDQYLNDGHGTTDDYMKHLRESALLWTTWRGNQIVARELEWIERQNEEENELRKLSSSTKEAPTLEVAKDGRLVVDGIPQELDETSSTRFEFQLADDLQRQSDLMLLKFGAPKEEIMQLHKPRRRKIGLQCRPEVVDELASFLVRAERAVPGLNSSELILLWADMLAGTESEAIPSLFDRIANRTDELAGGPGVNSPFANMHLYPTPPWVLDELPPRRRAKALADNDLQNISNSVKRLNELKARIELERRELEEPKEALRCKAAKRLTTHPRASAEERVLRALVRCSTEDKRLEALEGAIGVMVEVKERGGRFWTSAARAELFELLATIEGDADLKEIAAMCEDKEWWSMEIEDLFFDDYEEDEEWRDLMKLDRDKPVQAAVFAARIIDNMERAIRGRLAAGRFGRVFFEESKARQLGDFERMDEQMAKRLVLEREMREVQYRTEEEKERLEEEKREREEEEQLEREEEEMVRVLESGGELPFNQIMEERAESN